MKAARVSALVVTSAVIVAACGGDDGGSGGASTAGAASDVLRYGLEMEINLSDTFDPAGSRAACDAIVLNYIYDTLIRVDENGELVPGLAESWDLDAEGMTIVLRPDLTFHDGSVLDAEAVKASIEHLQTGEQTGSELAPISAIEVVDPRTVRLSFDEPAGTMPFTLTGRQGMVVASSSLEAGNTATDPIGAGPFRFESFNPGQSIELSANDEYWDADAYDLEGIRYVQVGVGPPAVSALRSGELDLITFLAESLPDVGGDDRLAMATGASEQYLQLQFRISRPNPDDRDSPIETVFADPLVRKAVNHAINRERINEIVLAGEGEVAWMSFSSQNPAYVPGLAERYPYDPDRARDLLAQAGLPDGFEFEMVIPGGGIVSQERQAELLQADLAEVGITANITRSTEIAAEYYIQKTGDAFAAARLPNANQVLQLDHQWGEFEFVAIHNGAEHPEITELTRAAQQTIDEAERLDFISQAVEISVDEALEVPIAFQPRHAAWDATRVSGTPQVTGSACAPIGLEGLSLDG